MNKAWLIGLTTIGCAAMGRVSLAQIYPTPDDPLVGDVNLDGIVDGADLAIVLVNFGQSDRVTRRMGDTNWNGVINSQDLSNVLTTWGTTKPALPAAPDVDLALAGPIPPSDGTITTLGDIFDFGASGNPRLFRDRTLVNPTQWAPSGVPSLSPVIDAAWRSDGVDLTLTYTNPNTYPMHPAPIQLPILDRTGTRKYRDFKFGGMIKDPNYNSSGNWSGPMLGYPGSLYAPVAVIENVASGHAVGISVHYPVLERRHELHFYLSDFNGNGGMLLSVLPNPDNPNVATDYDPDANIQPDETRTFEIAIRVRHVDYTADHEGEWMHTLRPYRRWFRGNYGGVQYERRAEQVRAAGLSASQHLSETNPRGFTKPTTHRPDVFGFEPWRTEWDGLAALGWERMMLWHPTGLYRLHPYNNFPPQFTSEWPAILATVDPPYNDTTEPLETYAEESGGTLGLWWGRSSQIADVWDDDVLETLDPSNSSHWAFRDNEMAGAVAVNASEIGLDAFSAAGRWESYWTLVRDRALYPGVRFITESAHPDFVHTLAPTFEVMTQDPGSTTGQLFQLPQGVPVMDFLMPGHETWGMMEARWIKTKLGLSQGASLPPEDTRPFITDAAALGLVPVFFGIPAEELTSDEFDAAETWLDTVPPGLQ